MKHRNAGERRLRAGLAPWGLRHAAVALLALSALAVLFFSASAAASPPDPSPVGRTTPLNSSDVVLRLEPGTPPEAVIRTVPGARVVDGIPQINAYRVRLPEQSEPSVRIQGRSSEELPENARELGGQKGVRSVETLHSFRTSETADSDYPADADWWLQVIGAPEVWSRPEAVLAPIVAVVDTGFDVDLLDFRGRITGARNFTKVGAPTDVDDVDHHGTRVAAILAAEGGNNFGIAGVNWQARLMPLKAGSNGILYSFDAAKAIVHAADNGAKIINLSWGFHISPDQVPEVANALSYARAAGALTVAAAGNIVSAAGEPAQTAVMYPASDPNTLAVGSVTRQLVRSSFSCFGTQLNLVAPGGGDPLGGEDDYIETLDAGGLYSPARGTSFSAPMVSGAASLLLSARPGLSPTQLTELLMSTAVDLGDEGRDNEYGAGLVDADEAFEAALTVTPKFSDVRPYTLYEEQILELAQRGIVQGFLDGSFRPEEKVMRQQFAKMVTLTLGLHTPQIDLLGDPTFADVGYHGDPYPYDFVEEAAAAGIVIGYTDGSFGPYNSVTRAQLITMVARAAGLAPAPVDYQPPFPEFDQVHYPWARAAAAAGLLEGLAGVGDAYEFYAPASRGEVCALLFNLLE